MKKVIRGSAALVLGAAMALGPAAVAAEVVYAPTEKAAFNDPWGGYDATWAIVREINAAIDGTPSGETILISTYLLDLDSTVDKLLAARNRGVGVQIVMDADVVTAQSERLIQAFNADDPPAGEDTNVERGGPDRSFVIRCDGSCRGGLGANNHVKFYAFSRTGQASDVIQISSANINRGGATRGWNDHWTMVGRPQLFADFRRMHDEMADDTDRDGDSFQSFTEGPYIARFYPMPRASLDEDPVLGDLNRVRCTGASNTPSRRTEIDISMYYWAGPRGDSIAKKLVALGRDGGCKVRVIYGAPSRDIAAYLKLHDDRGHIRLWDSRHFNSDGVYPRTHEKYFIIRGNYGGVSNAHQVWTGSQNWGAESLRYGDEIQVGIKGHAAWAQYRSNWNMVASYSRERR